MLDFVPNKREFLAHLFKRFGILAALDYGLRVQQSSVVVLTYHRIASTGTDSFYDPVISATPEAFRAQIDWLYGQFEILDLSEFLAWTNGELAMRRPAALITFDDGYRDNFDVAVPILRAAGVPATFFLATGFLDEPKLPWWDHVAYIIKSTGVRRFTVATSPGANACRLSFDLVEGTRQQFIKTVVNAFLDGSISNQAWFLDELGSAAQVSVDATLLGRKLFGNWNQVRELAATDSNLTFGSHAKSHPRLADLDEASERVELAESKEILERQLGKPIQALAYPYGWPGSFTARSSALAREIGYQVAFTSMEGVNRHNSMERFEMKRFGIGMGDSASLLRARVGLHGCFSRSFL
jgi:peptidoglycan/xylan/chitin deacetylase (PgdA/CDA1 family)